MFHKNYTKYKKTEKGFTLIELSIVLVIIGLIVGGVLVGQDLIRAAEIRATISQYEKYNTAVNTFRNKYNGIPGDLASATATSFGIYAPTTGSVAGTTGYGDGNGLIEGGAASATAYLGEPPMFFRHLTDASLIDGSYGASMSTAGALGADTTTATNSSYFPPAKLGRGNYFSVASASGINYFGIVGPAVVTAATGEYAAGTNNLTAQEAYNIDKKVDDGLPATGSVFAISSVAALSTASTWTTVNAVADCVASSAYVLSPGTTQACSLRLRFN